MTKYGLLVTSPVANTKNIGDYMQSLAAMQFLPKDFVYVEKEKVSKFRCDEPTKVIMNGWYMWHPENWPPKEEKLIPLLTSMHFTPITVNEMLKNGGKEYLQKYGPVGCRDKDSCELLKKEGIDCYFSGCMTLTLGKNYSFEGERKGVCFVDPYIPSLRIISNDSKKVYPINAVKAVIYYLMHPRKINRLAKIPFFKGRLKFLAYFNASMFYHAYSALFEDEVLFNADYFTHMVPTSLDESQESLFKRTEVLLKKYASSQYVVTSRIHCALPCVGVGTPVIFTLNEKMESKKNLIGSPGRYGGLIDLFHVVNYCNDNVSTKEADLLKEKKLTLHTKFYNKPQWKEIADGLISQCESFVRS
jgi:hypothetical protein